MNQQSHRRRRLAAARLAAAAAGVLVALAAGSAPALADQPPPPVTPPKDTYSLELLALTGPTGADLRVAVRAAEGAPAVDAFKEVKLKTFAADGSVEDVDVYTQVSAPGGVRTFALGTVARGRRVSAHVVLRTGDPPRTYVEYEDTTTLLRPDLVVEELTVAVGGIPVQQRLVGEPVDVSAVLHELNGDVGVAALVSISAVPGSAHPVAVAKGGRLAVEFKDLVFDTAVPVSLTVEVTGAGPAETDAANNAASTTLDVTEHQLPTPRTVLFPSLLGYGAQFNNHVYAPVTPWPPDVPYADFEDKVKALQPQLVRIFYNENWDGNANGQFPNWQENYESFVLSVELAQAAGATIDISYQSLGATTRENPGPAMARYADVLEDLVRNHRLTNVRWAEVGNEPNAPTGAVTLDQYDALYRALHAELVARDLRGQIQLMGGGLIESSGARHHYIWMPWIAANMGDILDGYAQHIYWWYDQGGRLEYRLRDVGHLHNEVLPPEQRKPTYMMEFGIRGYNSCTGKPTLAAANHLYYRPGDCADIWRTNIAAFQQLWFNLHSAQLGVAGTSKWDAYWGRYDNSSVNNQLYWLIGPASEGSPLTPSYHALSLLFHTTTPGWQIVGLEPWESNDWTVPTWGATGGGVTDDSPEKELVGYAGPDGELTIIGLDTHGRALNTASTEPPVAYSIGGLPPARAFTLALWNASGDGTSAVAGVVTTNAAGVARFEVPLQAAFALTTVPLS
jgi:hypothetical protein